MRPHHARKWKYNDDIEEYFVEDETTVKLKKADTVREQETTELDVGWPNAKYIYTYIEITC